jgi:lysylphosphatidylglycerol synthetase-like protein (DUF2156 family)
MLTDLKHRHNEYFRPFPLQGTYALIASLALAGLVALAVGLALAK